MSDACALLGCPRPVRSRGLCEPHYHRAIRAEVAAGRPVARAESVNRHPGCGTCGAGDPYLGVRDEHAPWCWRG